MTHCSAGYQTSSRTGLHLWISSPVTCWLSRARTCFGYKLSISISEFAFCHLKSHSELEVYFNVYMNIKKLTFFSWLKLEAKPSGKIATSLSHHSHLLSPPIAGIKARVGVRQTNPRNFSPESGPLRESSCFVISVTENVEAMLLIDIVGGKSDFISWWTRTMQCFC